LPTQVGTDHDWEQFSVGGEHVCAIKSDKSLHCWGENSLYQVGNGTHEIQTEPQPIGGDNQWKSVSAGGLHTCAIDVSGALYCWGYGFWHQLGFDPVGGASDANAEVPTQVGESHDWALVFAGGEHTCALKTNGDRHCWGENRHGELGDQTYEQSGVVPHLIEDENRYTMLGAGWSRTCGISDDEKLYCWGLIGRNSGSAQPALVGGDTSWKSLSAGYGGACAIDALGALYCFGDNAYGQIGDGTEPDRFEPYPVRSDETWSDVFVGESHTCGVTTSGQAQCWGQNAYGQLGFEDEAGQVGEPSPVSGNLEWSELSLTRDDTCGVTTQGELYCWGARRFFAATGLEYVSAPTRVGNANDWATVHLGELYGCGTRKSGALFCWGYDKSGALGLGPIDSNASPILIPTQVGIEEDWVQVLAGDYNTMGLKADGSVYIWGRLADGEQANSPVPIELGGGFERLLSDRRRYCVLGNDGRLGCFWPNLLARLAQDIEPGLPQSIDITPGQTWKSAGVGGEDCAISESGELYCWRYDQPGNEMIVQPTRVGMNSDWSEVKCSAAHCCAIQSDGLLNCWGYGLAGQLGHGDEWKEDLTRVELPSL
jgi:alpha-tubulin suppressor-like RCC1 family protein